jgi:drug/metabolite transporter (DMT)-like permease
LSTLPTPGWKYYSGLSFGILFVSTASILIRFSQAEVPSIVIAAYRLSIAALILGILIAIKRINLSNYYDKQNIWLAILSGLFLALHFAAWITSLEYTSVASSVVLVTTTPIWVTIFSRLVLKEDITKNVVWGLLFALIGMVIVSFSDVCIFSGGRISCNFESDIFTGKSLLGNILALSGAFMAAGYMLAGRKLRKTVPTLPYTFVVYGIAAIVVDIVVLITGAQFFSFSESTYIWLVALAIIPQLLGHSLFNWALEFLPASVVSIALLGEPVGTIMLAFVFLREVPTLIEALGACLILVGIIVASFLSK